jgi:hypothetical protein
MTANLPGSVQALQSKETGLICFTNKLLNLTTINNRIWYQKYTISLNHSEEIIHRINLLKNTLLVRYNMDVNEHKRLQFYTRTHIVIYICLSFDLRFWLPIWYLQTFHKVKKQRFHSRVFNNDHNSYRKMSERPLAILYPELSFLLRYTPSLSTPILQDFCKI